jgi:hypothetical protein
MATGIVIYWAAATLMTFGSLMVGEDRSKLVGYFIVSVITGWFVFPTLIGDILCCISIVLTQKINDGNARSDSAKNAASGTLN